MNKLTSTAGVQKNIMADTEGGGLPQSTNVIAYRNEIYFYDDICDKTVFELRKCLIAVKEFIESDESEDYEDCAVIFINSYGGEYHAGMAAYSFIKNFPYPVFTVIEGGAASAATIVYMAGERKFMYKHSNMLIHQLSREMIGKFTDLQDELASSKKFMDCMKQIYLDNSNIKQKKLEDLIGRETWLTYEEAKALNLVDDYYDTFAETKNKKAKKKNKKEKKARAKEDKELTVNIDETQMAELIMSMAQKKQEKTKKKISKIDKDEVPELPEEEKAETKE